MVVVPMVPFIVSIAAGVMLMLFRVALVEPVLLTMIL